MGKVEQTMELLAEAMKARERAYAPYSRFAVGAALLGKSGQIYRGCNVENASYGATICAERAAVANAICAGERGFRAIAVVADTPHVPSPCGICRQVLAEFGAGMNVIMGNLSGCFETVALGELYPRSFGGSALGGPEQG